MNLIVHKYGLVLSITINFRKLEYNEPHNAIDSAESQYMATVKDIEQRTAFFFV